VDDESEDALDAQYVNNERLEDMAYHEAKAISPMTGNGQALPPQGPLMAGNGQALPPQARDMALRFNAWFVNLLNMPFETWFQSAALLDVYCRRYTGPDLMDRLPATCVALVKMLKKVDNAGVSMKGSNLSVHAGHLGEALRREGIRTDITTEEMLNEQEMSLLMTVDWKMAIPSIESWLSTYCTRFNVLTKRLLVPSLLWVWERTVFCARILMMHNPATVALPPRRQANGLLGLGFVSARLLPLDAIRPEKQCPTVWEQLFLQIQEQLFLQIQGTTAQQVGVPTCVLRENHAKRILELLRVTLGTGSDLEDLQQDCEDVALQLHSALAGIRGAPPPGSSVNGSPGGSVAHASV
jgi:hypothetical protein